MLQEFWKNSIATGIEKSTLNDLEGKMRKFETKNPLAIETIEFCHDEPNLIKRIIATPTFHNFEADGCVMYSIFEIVKQGITEYAVWGNFEYTEHGLTQFDHVIYSVHNDHAAAIARLQEFRNSALKSSKYRVIYPGFEYILETKTGFEVKMPAKPTLEDYGYSLF